MGWTTQMEWWNNGVLECWKDGVMESSRYGASLQLVPTMLCRKSLQLDLEHLSRHVTTCPKTS